MITPESGLRILATAVVPGGHNLVTSPWKVDITRYLPNGAGAAMSGVVRFPSLFSPLGGFLLLTTHTVATLAMASMVFVHRDA